jgi:ribosomal protein L20A (L18A)
MTTKRFTKNRKRFTKKRNRITNKRRGGKKQKNCTSTCKAKFSKEVQKDKRFKALNKISSFFGAKKTLGKELNSVLNSKDIQNNKVFKNCVKDCEK